MWFAANIFESCCEASAQDAAQNIDKKIEEIGVKIQKTEEEARKLWGMRKACQLSFYCLSGQTLGGSDKLSPQHSKPCFFSKRYLESDVAEVQIQQPRHVPCRP